MFFVLSKIFWILFQPVSIILVLILLGVLLVWRRHQRWGLSVLLGASLGLLLIGYTNLGALLIQPLENRFPRPAEPPAAVAAIIVLGGATDGAISRARGVSELNMAGDRITEAVALARRYPGAQVVFSGGIGQLTGGAETEAETAERFFLAQGVARERLVLEDAARNTSENASNIARLLNGFDGDALLVTSAFHMPRSVGLFRQRGMTVLPWPADYRSTGTESFGFELSDAASNVMTFTTASREWIGLLAYALRGDIAEIFPGP